MKRVTILMMFLLLILASSAFAYQAFEEAQTQVLPASYSAEADLKKMQQTMGGLEKKLDESAERNEIGHSAISGGISTLGRMAGETFTDVKEIKAADKKNHAVAKEILIAEKAGRENLKDATALQLLAIAGTLIILIFVIVRVASRNREREDDRARQIRAEVEAAIGRGTTAVNAVNEAIEGNTDVIKSTNAKLGDISSACHGTMTAIETIVAMVKGIDEKVDKVPEETARRVRELNPAPFEFDVSGHHATYVSPPEGIAEGYYRTLQIEEMPDKNNPATFIRQTEHRRGIALNYVRGTMKKFFEGKLKGAPEEALIIYLQSIGEIKIRKTS